VTVLFSSPVVIPLFRYPEYRPSAPTGTTAAIAPNPFAPTAPIGTTAVIAPTAPNHSASTAVTSVTAPTAVNPTSHHFLYFYADKFNILFHFFNNMIYYGYFSR